eukprot:TRINITY_DN4801_c0_g2_i1.p1 TRINITY_DN4801_c0_g2~~TRINITY_DN4801_c0_g2_i1.p1  ORF type:complete len:170 (-),score=38.12 TRINITY_DN4801_c0_g2_i1:78-587(-)
MLKGLLVLLALAFVAAQERKVYMVSQWGDHCLSDTLSMVPCSWFKTHPGHSWIEVKNADGTVTLLNHDKTRALSRSGGRVSLDTWGAEATANADQKFVLNQANGKWVYISTPSNTHQVLGVPVIHVKTWRGRREQSNASPNGRVPTLQNRERTSRAHQVWDLQTRTNKF